jgi:hypothetical protein
MLPNSNDSFVFCFLGGQANLPGYEMKRTKGLRCKRGGVYQWQKSIGFSNPFIHILNCCYDGQMNALLDAYWETHDRKAGQDILSFFSPVGG